MALLPSDIFQLILAILPAQDVFSMQRVNKEMYQLAQCAARKWYTAILSSPRYHSKHAIAKHTKLVMRLAQSHIVPSTRQQLWALESVILSKHQGYFDTFKSTFHLIPEMYPICIRLIQEQDQEIKQMAAQFMHYMASKDIQLCNIYEAISGKSVDEIIEMWLKQRTGGGPVIMTLALGSNRDVFNQPGYDAIDVSLGSLYGASLIIACRDDHHVERLIKLLQNPLTNVNLVNGNGTALTCAAEKGFVNSIKLLLEHPEIDVNQRDAHGDSALGLACQMGQQRIVELLLSQSGMDVNQRDRCGRSALMMAARRGDMAMVELLLEHTLLDMNLSDYDGRSALTFASENRYNDIVNLFMEHPRFQKNTTQEQRSIELHESNTVELVKENNAKESWIGQWWYKATETLFPNVGRPSNQALDSMMTHLRHLF